jgi:hypothetical protein
MSSAATPLLLATLAAWGGGPGDDAAHAPPPLEIDGLVGHPIDIESVSATFHFDHGARSARARAVMRFEVIGAGGMPLFDLRQEVERAWLDGEELDPAALAAHEIGPQAGTMRILERELAGGETHELVLEYPLAEPSSPQAQGIGWSEDGLSWDTWFSDLNPGRYLEMWMPANLLYDRHSVELELRADGLPQPHELVTNASIEVKGEHHWLLRFPANSTAFSPMVVLLPADRVERSQTTERIAGRRFTIDVCRRLDAPGDLDRIHEQVADDLEEFIRNTGPWAHSDRVSVLIWRGGRSMEYDGATTSSIGALRHELFHSWWGRGVKPATQNDGWFDEAWNVYFADREGPSPGRVKEGPPVELCSSDPWNRITARASYGAGSAFFARLAGEIGEKRLVKLMADFYREHVHRPVTTAELEAHLAEGSRKPEAVRRLFHRYVYGREGAPQD